MNYDQASALRKKVEMTSGKVKPAKVKPTKVITISSGKGGVGKSNFTLNFALGLLDIGHKTAVLDADIGLANIDVLLGVAPKYTLIDLLRSHLKIWDIIEKGPNGLQFISGGSELESIFDLKNNNLPYLFDQLLLLNGHLDTLLIDTGAGLNQDSLKFILSSDEVMVITTPEPTSITDTYAMIKMIQSKNKDMKVNLIINQIANEPEGISTAEKIKLASERFLGFKVDVLGYIYRDECVSRAVKRQEPFYLLYPNCKASRDIRILISKYTNSSLDTNSYGVRTFLDKMTYWFKK